MISSPAKFCRVSTEERLTQSPYRGTQDTCQLSRCPIHNSPTKLPLITSLFTSVEHVAVRRIDAGGSIRSSRWEETIPGDTAHAPATPSVLLRLSSHSWTSFFFRYLLRLACPHTWTVLASLTPLIMTNNLTIRTAGTILGCRRIRRNKPHFSSYSQSMLQSPIDSLPCHPHEPLCFAHTTRQLSLAHDLVSPTLSMRKRILRDVAACL